MVHHRADGSIAYAENPPKKYQDIYPINFDTDYPGPLAEVRADRAAVDGPRGPHLPGGQPAHQAAALLGAAARRTSGPADPDVLFLAEAFTRPAMMASLAKVGFDQSYTYFTWRNEQCRS